MKSNSGPLPRSPQRILQVLRLVAEHTDNTSLARLSEMTGTPKTSLLALLRALTKNDYLQYTDGQYTLGAASFLLSAAIASRRVFPGIARRTIDALADASGETALLAEFTPERDAAVYIDKAESKRAIRYIAAIGDRRALYSSAGGRVLLAYQPEEWRNKYLAKVKLVPLTSSTVTDKKVMQRTLESIRKTGVAVTVQQVTDDVVGFGAPIFDQTGAVAAAVIIGAPLSRGVPNKDRFSKLVKEAAAEISGLLGYKP